MSSGSFARSKYADDSGVVHPIRIQPETLALTIGGTANAAPAGNIAAGVVSAKVSGSSRSLGLTARKVRFQFSGAVPDGYKPASTISLPWLVQSTFGAISPNATGTYLGQPIIVLGKSGETLK